MGSHNLDGDGLFVIGVLEFSGKVQTEGGRGSHKHLERKGKQC